MSAFVPWNSQPLDAWASKYAEGRFVDLNSHRAHYIERGEGKPVILLHGFNYDAFLWAANIDFLAEKFRVCALDLWGFGYSSRKPMDYSYQLYADQVLDFMDALGIYKASIVGQSMGGGTAILFAVQHPERVSKLVLVDPGAMPQPYPLVVRLSSLPKVGEFFFGLKTDRIRRKTLADMWFYDKSLVTDDYFEKASRYQKIAGTSEAALAILRKRFFYTLEDEVHRLSRTGIPVLTVFGREDKGVSPKSGEEIHKTCKGSRLEFIEKAGHLPNYERSETFNRMAMEFLAS
jgi:pimeloyl-ACP methyl ester carboxylesterase